MEERPDLAGLAFHGFITALAMVLERLDTMCKETRMEEATSPQVLKQLDDAIKLLPPRYRVPEVLPRIELCRDMLKDQIMRGHRSSGSAH